MKITRVRTEVQRLLLDVSYDEAQEIYVGLCRLDSSFADDLACGIDMTLNAIDDEMRPNVEDEVPF